MGKHIQLILFPPDKTPNDLFLFAVDQEPFGGWVRSDGSFTKGESIIEEAYEAMGFISAEQALAWAKSHNHHIVNEWMFTGVRAVMPDRVAVLVTDANHTPWYAYHETVERRQNAGESITQLEIKFETLTDITMPWGGCYVLVDTDATHHLQAAGIAGLAEMVGRILVLESDEPSDPTCPLRIVQIRKN